MTARVWPVAAVTGSPTYDGRYLRQTTVAPLIAGATAARPLGARSGVRPGTSTTTVTATTTQWTVNALAGIIDGESANEAGPYAFSFDAAVTGTMTAANASYARIDLISVQVSDPAESDGSSTPSIAIVYTPGTAAAPALPTQPVRSMVIAQINVPISGGGSPSVTWVAPTLTAAGGITPATSAAFGNGTYVGQYIDDPSAGLLRWNGTAWTVVARGASQAPSYGAAWRTPTTQPGAPVSFIKTGTVCTVLGGQFENSVTLTLPATGQNASAITVPTGCAPAAQVIVPAFITNTSASANTLGALWFKTDGTVTFQTSAAISAAPAGTISVAIGGAQWVTP